MGMSSSTRVVRTPIVIGSVEDSESVLVLSGVATSYRLKTSREHKVDAMLIIQKCAMLVFKDSRELERYGPASGRREGASAWRLMGSGSIIRI